jgi:hypothetical protein
METYHADAMIEHQAGRRRDAKPAMRGPLASQAAAWYEAGYEVI